MSADGLTPARSIGGRSGWMAMMPLRKKLEKITGELQALQRGMDRDTSIYDFLQQAKNALIAAQRRAER
jgi:DNA-binding FrmR family transcriptional regulator